MRNMKINVENNLDEIVAELESMGYQESMFTPNKNAAFIVTYESGSFTDWGKFDGGAYNCGLTTLAELRSMNIETLKEMQ